MDKDKGPKFILSELRVKDPKTGDQRPPLSEEQIRVLLSATFKDSNQKIITAADTELLYEVINNLLAAGQDFAKYVDFLRSTTNREQAIFYSPLMTSARENAEIIDEALRNKPIKLKTGIKCIWCGSIRTQYTQSQGGRSSDESTALIVYCFECNRNFTQR